MEVLFSGFDWDEGNRDKCRKHGVAPASIEVVLRGPLAVFPAPHSGGSEDRLKAIGVDAEGRHVFVVFTLRRHGDRLLIRPISARHMHRKEIEHYERQATKTQSAAEPDDG